GHAFSIQLQESRMKAKHMIARGDYLVYRRILHHRDRVPHAGDLRRLIAVNLRARLDYYFVICPAGIETLYELRINRRTPGIEDKPCSLENIRGGGAGAQSAETA